MEQIKLSKKQINKIYYQKTKHSLKYYHNNKHLIQNKRRNDKYTCECGKTLRKDGKSNHLKTKKHLNFIKNKNNNTKCIECV